MNIVKIEDVVKQLDDFTSDYPVNQLYNELQVLVERLSFSKVLQDMTSQNEDRSSDILESLLRQDVSKGLLEFTKYLNDNKMLGFLRNEMGQEFLRYCEQYFFHMNQVVFMTAIPLKEEKRKAIAARIKHLYPQKTRILFSVNPSIMAGFVVKDYHNFIIDYSLRSRAVNLVKFYLKSMKVASGSV